MFFVSYYANLHNLFAVLYPFIMCPFLFADPPIVVLTLGSKLQAGDIKEGDDVYFECKIEANPQWRKLTWLHNVSNC